MRLPNAIKKSIYKALAVGLTVVASQPYRASAQAVLNAAGNRIAAGQADSPAVNVQYQEWHDATRDRDIPVKLYLPKDLARPCPIVVFSHGLGGSREAAPYLGNYWAAHGYVGVFIQHPGSDESFWKPGLDGSGQNPPLRDKAALLGKFREQLKDPMHAVNRTQDVHFVIDQLERLNASDPSLRGKLDLSELAIAGHSFGSWTALAASGQQFVTRAGRTISSVDPRIKAAIYLSPTPPRNSADPKGTFGAIKIPGLHLTGTADVSPVNDTKAEERRIAFDNISQSDQYLVILNGADHMVFGGGGARAARFLNRNVEEDELHRKLTEETSTAFLDAYLKHDQHAKDWLTKTAPSYLKPYGTYEMKAAMR